MKNLILINLVFFSAFVHSSESSRPRDMWVYHGPVQVAKVVHKEDGLLAIIIPENLLPGEPFMIEGMGERLFKATARPLEDSLVAQIPSAVREQADLTK